MIEKFKFQKNKKQHIIKIKSLLNFALNHYNKAELFRILFPIKYLIIIHFYITAYQIFKFLQL